MNDPFFVKTWVIFTQGYVLCQVWLKWVSQVVLEKKCEILSMYLCYFILIPPWKRTWPLIWTNLNPHYSRMSCEIGREVLEEIKIKIRWMDNRWSEKLTCAFSSGELKIHYSLGFFQGVGVVVCVWCGVGHNYNYIYVKKPVYIRQFFSSDPS